MVRSVSKVRPLVSTGAPRANEIKSSGRRQALQVLDTLLANSDNLRKLREDMQEAFDAAPLRFFMEVAMPVMPKQTIIDASNDKQALQIVLTSEPSIPLLGEE